MASLNFDANEVEPSSPLDPIPDGNYLAVVTASEVKPTKSGTGSYLQLTFEVIEGDYKSRLLWTRLNLDNPNATAVQIARQELSAICRAVGVMKPQESQELHDLPLIVDVRSKKRSDSNEMTNVVKGYYKVGQTPVAGVATGTATNAVASRAVASGAVAVGGAAPWKRA